VFVCSFAFKRWSSEKVIDNDQLSHRGKASDCKNHISWDHLLIFDFALLQVPGSLWLHKRLRRKSYCLSVVAHRRNHNLWKWMRRRPLDTFCFSHPKRMKMSEEEWVELGILPLLWN
jgi:hypothetical protein